MSYPPIPQRKSCDCSDPCISTDDVYYAGPNLPNSGVNTSDLLTEVIEKLDAIYAVPTLQRVTEMGNYTTLPIIADSFVKIGGNGTNVLLDNGNVLPIGNLPTGVTETSQLINDGEDGINPFITALDIPAFNPSDYDLDEFTNNNVDPFVKMSDIAKPYKVYTALLTQVGTSDPTAIVLENTIGTITLSRNSTGSYYINSPNLFTVDKTFTQITSILFGDIHYLITYGNISRISVVTSNAATTFLDGKLDNTPIEIRVYN